MSEHEPTPTPELVTVKIDGKEHQLPKGKNLLEALLDLGEDISYFCYHPGLSVAASCRQCLVGIRGSMVPSCQTTVSDGLELESQSPTVLDARRQMLEFTLVNHPVDCVICDKAGECTLQRHYMDWDGKPSEIDHEKVEKPKKVDVGREIVLDAERCILCSRCVRFCQEIAESPDLVFEYRGNHETLTTAPDRRLDNSYSLNTVDICPVGALTDKDFRFKIRVWELYATRSVCNGCAAGCDTEVHHRDGRIYRMVPPKDWDMNLNWMCDDGRRTYKSVAAQRLTRPLVDGEPAELDAALAAIKERLEPLLAQDRGAIGVVLGADASNEDNFMAARMAYDFLEAGHVYLADSPDNGLGDDILRRDDPNPNRAGARGCARGDLGSSEDLARDLADHKLEALYVVGDRLDLSDETLGQLRGLKLVVVQASEPSRLTDKAHVVLPAAKWAEVHGTITRTSERAKRDLSASRFGRMRPAVEPPGMARPHWDWLKRVGAVLGVTVEFESAHAVFQEMKKQVPFFAEAQWGGKIPTVMLRFAGRRG
ncbi:MAG: (2Fe-2S)-binding protein [Myxococcales bacterium]|nr:(2Fe-2S)-binding protein [Myxococcales bacterium]